MAPQPRLHSPQKPKGSADSCHSPKQTHHLPAALSISLVSNKRKPISLSMALFIAAVASIVALVLLITLIAILCCSNRFEPAPMMGSTPSMRGATISPESTNAIRIAVSSFMSENDGTNTHVEHAVTIPPFDANAAVGEFPPNDDGAWPKVAWLMSFPNAGTSYTLHLTRTATATTTASNYALEGDFKDRPSIPIHLNASNAGPFLQLVRDRTTMVPKTHILTKTHCGGFCSDCLPEAYLETPRSFQRSCQTGRKAYLDQNGSLKTSPVTYDAGLVRKAVHIIRNPLDNIVARFHLDWKKYRDKGKQEWTAAFPYNATGFQRWCQQMDRNNKVSQSRWVDDKLALLMKAIPCQEEFLRYVQWHNLAFSVTRDMGIPTHMIHYHDYRDDWEGTVTKLLHFLELTRTEVGEPFVPGKEYQKYYTAEDRLAIKAFIQEYASAETWENVKDFNY